MTFDFGKKWREKEEWRKKQAELPIEEKLAILDRMRKQAQEIKSSQKKKNLEIPKQKPIKGPRQK